MQNPFLEIRRGLGLTRLQLSMLVGVRYDALWVLEAGAVNRPNPMTLKALQEALGVDPEELTTAYVAWRKEQQERLRQAQREQVAQQA